MMICLAALETNMAILEGLEDESLDYGLTSFFYLKDQEHFENVLKKVKYLLIDSGAHSFQHGKKVDFDSYTEIYARFIKRNTDNPKIIGFFEMDVDNVIGYQEVLRLRKKLTAVSDKIVPVWHQNRGVDDFIKTCEEWRGRRIAVTGFKNNDITDGQYNLFINEAHRHDCMIHILGCTRYRLINNLNLGLYDSVDSSSWKQQAIYNQLMLPYHENDIKTFEFFRGINFQENSLMKTDFLVAKYMQELYKFRDQSVIGSKQTNPLRNEGSKQSPRKEK